MINSNSIPALETDVNDLNTWVTTLQGDAAWLYSHLNTAEPIVSDNKDRLDLLSVYRTVGMINVLGNPNFNAGLTFADVLGFRIPHIVIEGITYPLVRNVTNENAKILELYLDYRSSPWRMVVQIMVDGISYTRYITLTT